MTDINKQIEEDKPIDEFFADLDNEMIDEYTKAGKLHPDFLPFPTYDLVQCGYPYPNHGEMIARRYGGTDLQDRLLPSKGEYCKVEDVKVILSKLQDSSRWRKVSEEMPPIDKQVLLITIYDDNPTIGCLHNDEGELYISSESSEYELDDIMSWKPIG